MAINKRRTSLSLDSETEKLAKTMIDHHKAASLTDYLRGLVILDVLIVKGNVNLSHIPTWLIASHSLNVNEGELQPIHLRKGKLPSRS